MANNPYNQEDEEQQKLAQQTQLAPSQPTPAPNVNVQTQAGPFTPLAKQPATPQIQQFGPQAQQLQQPATPPRQTTSTPVTAYSRLQNYLKSSQPQAQMLGSAVQQNVEQQATQGRQALGSAAQTFSQKVSANDLLKDPAKMQALIAKAANLAPNQSLTPEEIADLSLIEKNKQFSSQVPSSLTGVDQYGAARAAFDKAIEEANLTGDVTSLQALLEQKVQGRTPQYSGGQSLLDAILARTSQPSAQALNQLKQDYVTSGSINKEDKAALDAAAKQRQDVIDKTNAEQQALVSGLTGEQGSLTKFDQLLKSLPAAQQAKQAEILAKTKAELKNALMQKYNLPADGKLFGESLDAVVNKIVMPTSTAQSVTMEDVVSPEQLARINVLNKLAGRTANDVGGSTIGELAKAQFDPTAKLDFTKAAADINTQLAQAKNSIKQQAQNALNIKFNNWGEKQGKQAVLNQSQIGGYVKNGFLDAREMDNSRAQFNEELNKINQARKAYGLPAVNITAADVEAAKKEILDTRNTGQPFIAYVNVKTGQPWSPPPGDDGTALQNMINAGQVRQMTQSERNKQIAAGSWARYNKPGNGEDHFRAGIDAGARLRATYYLLEKLANNPLLGAPSSQLDQSLPAWLKDIAAGKEKPTNPPAPMTGPVTVSSGPGTVTKMIS